jgi:hypothetical protein
LSRIIAPFSADTIKFNYAYKVSNVAFSFPQVTFVRNSDGVRTATYTPMGYNSFGSKSISSIVFPDKTKISFIYSYQYKYDGVDMALSKIKIGDTAFRYGYMLDYDDRIDPAIVGNTDTAFIRLTLKSITPYTAKEKKPYYQFSYASRLPELGSLQDTIQNSRDYWGFFNGVNNGDVRIPQVNGYTWGADRTPNLNATYHILSSMVLPSGGMINYYYELNDHLPYIKQKQSLSIAAATSVQDTISLKQVFNSKHTLNFLIDSTVSRTGSAPISGSGNLDVAVKSLNGSITYTTASISLYNLFYQGIKSWSFNLPDGSYRLETSLSSGSSITGSFPVRINWENKVLDTAHSSMYSGGLRVASIQRSSHVNGGSNAVISTETYKYVREDGKSSGFLGDIPEYDYPYMQTVINGSTTTTSYTAVSSEPLTSTEYLQGSTVGYARVEVINGTTSHNTGKTVYEFTGLSDVNTNLSTVSFPYKPTEIRAWGIGLPKKVSAYDSVGVLVKRTVNTYGIDTADFITDNFKSLKLGNSATIHYGDPASPSTPKTKTFIGQEYYPSCGRVYLLSTLDTVFHENGTYNASIKNYAYDTNFNVKKIVSDYNRSEGLKLEQRYYYPYNYVLGGAIGRLRDSSVIAVLVANENWIIGDTSAKLIAATIKGFRSLGSGNIKPDTIFRLETVKPLASSVIGAFDSSKLVRSATYLKPEVCYTGYDNYGNPTEVKNLSSGQVSSMITDYNGMYGVARVANGSVADIAYTSFESDGSGSWTIGSASRNSTDWITGTKSYDLSNGAITRSSLLSSKAYILTFWAKSTSSVSVNSASPGTAIAQQNGWNLYSVALTGITSLAISGTGLIDELRLHPKEATMMTYTYEPLIGVTSTTDANNTIVYDEYDNLNRLKLVRDKNRNIIKRYEYSDTLMLVDTLPNWQFYMTSCSGQGWKDSLYINNSVFSDTYKSISWGAHVFDPCHCGDPGTFPSYKLVSGVCEEGVRVNTSSVRTKINGVFKWICTYHYEWSDSSHSSDYTQINDSSCPLGSTN